MKEQFDPTKSRILIVDDSPVNIALLTETLKKQGYNTDTANNGFIALEKVKSEVYDLILLDIMMPRIDGFEVCIQLKQNENTKDIPVIFLTAVTNPASIVKGFEVGGVDYVTKPFQNAELFKRVQNHIELKKSKEQLIKELSERKKAEKVIMQNLLDQEFLTFISNELLNIDNFKSKIQQIINEIGKHSNVSRVYIFENLANNEFTRNTYEWCNGGIQSYTYGLQSFFYTNFLSWREILKNNGQICISDINTLPDEIKNYFYPDVISILISPLFINNDFFGLITFNECRYKREWSKSEAQLLKTIANILSNVYERYNIYNNLRESEGQFRDIFELSNDCVIIFNFDGNILEANELCSKILGYSKQEITNSNLKQLLPATFSNMVFGRLFDKAKIIESPLNEYEVITKEGRIIPFEVNSRIIKYKDSEAVLSICRDLTDRKQMERKIISTIIETEEKERNRFAKDLHDGLGALLSSINIYINMIRSGELSEAEQENMLIFTKGLIDQAISTAKEIANDLRPTILSRFGLVASVKSFCSQINNTRALQIDFDTDSFSAVIDKNTEIILFRIINELINNTIKHAEAKSIQMKLYNINQTLFFEFHDDGKGFDLSKKLVEKPNGMGLENIRSRIISINGKVDIKTKEGEGVKVIIEIRL